MFARIAAVAAGFSLLGTAGAEVVLLKEKASITGRILTEKRDLLVVDLGYTVLAVPRSEVVRVLREGEKEAKEPKGNRVKPSAAPTAMEKDATELFRTAKPNTPEKSVRDLVAQLGEAVVQ